jgi:hypothetical protein
MPKYNESRNSAKTAEITRKAEDRTQNSALGLSVGLALPCSRSRWVAALLIPYRPAGPSNPNSQYPINPEYNSRTQTAEIPRNTRRGPA